MTPMRGLERYGWLCLVGFVVVGTLQCHARRDGAAEARDRINQRNTQVALAALRNQRDSTDALRAAYVRSDISLRRMQARFDARDAAFADSLDALRGELADTALTNAQLRGIAERAVAQSEAYRQQVLQYRDSVAAYRHSAGQLIVALLAERAAADSVIAAQRREIQGLRDAGECRILAVAPCPSRVQSLFVGGGLTLLLVLL